MLDNGISWFRRAPRAALLLACVVLAMSSLRAAPAAANTAADPNSPVHAYNAPLIHIVQRGETLGAIARQYGATVAAIAQTNGIADPSRIYAGQRLVIPAPGSAPAPAAVDPGSAQGMHVVRPGESLSAIAQQHGVTVEAIAQANGVANPNRIYVGQQLVIPRGGAAVARPSTQELVELAAIVYAEAQANPVAFDEMLAIASVVRNRVEHVAVYPSDQRWFGGPGYHGVISNRREFPAYGTSRYWNFLNGTVGSPLEQIAADNAMRAATQVYSGGAPYPFVFFQQAATRPSARASFHAVHLGAHNFWSFRPECVNPVVSC